MVPLSSSKDDLMLIKDLVNDPKLSRIYGFILYTEKDPWMVQVLQNDAFWNSLDKRSGDNWPIFAVKPLVKGYYSFPHSRGSSISFMVRTWNEPSCNKQVLQSFRLEDSKDLPCFVAFIWDDDGELQSIAVPIKGSDVSTTYSSIEKIVGVISDTEKQVLPKYKNNVELYENVKDALKSLDFNCKLKKWGKMAKDVFNCILPFLSIHLS